MEDQLVTGTPQTDSSAANSPVNLAKFFAWARERAYVEFEQRMAANPELDPNWTFSDIMQELLADYNSTQTQS